MYGRENGERDKVGEENIEQLGKALFEDGPVGQCVHHVVTAFFLDRLDMKVVVVAVEALEKEDRSAKGGAN